MNMKRFSSGNIQCRTFLIDTSNKETDTERSAHLLLLLSAFSETQRKVANGERTRLNPHGFVVSESVVLVEDFGEQVHRSNIALMHNNITMVTAVTRRKGTRVAG